MAYDRAVSFALSEDGDDPYNCSISTTTGFTLLPMNENETSEQHRKRVMEVAEKWGNCCAWQLDIENHPDIWTFAGWAAT